MMGIALVLFTPTSSRDIPETPPHRPDAFSGALARFALGGFGSVTDSVVNGDGGFRVGEFLMTTAQSLRYLWFSRLPFYSFLGFPNRSR
jgi:hypothetical protein